MGKSGGVVGPEGLGFASEGAASRRGRGGKHGGGDGGRVGGPRGGGGVALARKTRVLVRKRQRLWGFRRAEVFQRCFSGGAVEAPEGRRESCGGWKKGAGRVEVRKEGKGCLREGDGRGEKGRQADCKQKEIGPWQV